MRTTTSASDRDQKIDTLHVIVGPTGTGKSALSLDLAERIHATGRAAEIINADAMQLYRGMDIGTAKLTSAERRGITHHQMDTLGVTEESTVAAYQESTRKILSNLVQREIVPILVGGSGLYVSSVIFNFDFPARDQAVRARLERECEKQGPEELFRRLADRDPVAAANIGSQNIRRVIRALEVIEITGAPFSAALPQEPVPWMPLNIVGLHEDRAVLTSRLDKRVLDMWDQGLLEEVEGLIPEGIEHGITASRAIGYAQALAQLRGDATRDEAIALTQSLTRRYSRRQVSWFKRYQDLNWIHASDPQRLERVLAHPPDRLKR
ncbi:tRNA (adenosine(37)-N6)-dimethylallyltransferase MiaA [Lysinibacter sp. HNR]|uniref:tRNA (adenosine(37)-N6)-dimethylallyltransferase MiaA n=1 Tax=Lysinibacter sp. HNR TaxID=3031408 RepID=UPI00243519B7|nr:tRNA (adenosine(37)-N6)-dimethylallyltransferase MiaA [Lysinibacter sp. HNR]WGD38280.1 tRNA (adenosine(37)-N6)-dimethylallyltransferase MiaA [Lysinibacter sp. HNR]